MAANANWTVSVQEKNRKADKPDKSERHYADDKAPREGALKADRRSDSDEAANAHRAQHPEWNRSAKIH